MGTIYQQINQLITTNPGNILYHLVLAFSILGTIQAALNVWRQESFPQNRRMFIGLGLLLVLRLLLSLAAVLSLVGNFDPQILLPNGDRVITALSLIIILWLWVYPEPVRLADATSGLLAVLILIIFLFLQGWWNTNSTDTNFNNTFAATDWEILALVLLGLGMLLLVLRRPNGWGYGLGMLATLTIGHLLQLLFPFPNSNFPGAVRLFEMAGYPLLWTLPHRFNLPKRKAVPVTPEREGREEGFTAQVQATSTLGVGRNKIDPELFRDILLLTDTTTPQTIDQKFTKLMAETFQSDICLLIYPSDDLSQIFIPCAYNLTQQAYLSNRTIDPQKVPLLLSAMKHSRPLRLPASSTSQDTAHITKVLDLEQAGHLLAAFVPSEGEELAQMGILLVSSSPEQRWSRNDQAFLNIVATTMVPILQHIQTMESIHEGFQTTWTFGKSLRTPMEETYPDDRGPKGEIKENQYQASQMQDKEKDELLEKLSESQEQIDKLREENLTLQTRVKNLSTSLNEQIQEPQHLREELKLALTEIAQLRNQFLGMEPLGIEGTVPPVRTKISQTRHVTDQLEDITSGLSDDQIVGFTAIIQDLRQPMSSIVGYTDLLLSETAGILGAVQRKFLERIQVSVQRIEIFLDDLVQIVSQDTVGLTMHPEKVDLEHAIDVAISETQSQFQERGIVLRLDLADEIPQFLADQDALQQILINLLKNAGTASPVNGEIFLRTSVYTADDKQDYVLIQVADQGGGIPADDLPRVFSRFYSADSSVIPGIGESSIALSIVKALVEAHKGRIWVDTELGKGSTLTLLIPLENGSQNQNRPEEEERTHHERNSQ